MDSGNDKLREELGRAKRWVVKIGSALATRQGMGLNIPAIEDWAGQMVEVKRGGREVVVVTSGSVAEGCARMGWTSRPRNLHQLQAAAAIGQMGLVRAWELAFKKYGMQAAQILLTHEDMASRERYLNSRSTLWTLLELDVFPVINENDTVATEEIRLGDNDTLAGLVSNLTDADLMIILTDQEGLMTADPRVDPAARLIHNAAIDDPQIAAIAGEGGAWGRGGMRTKITAAKLAARSETSTIIAAGHRPDVLRDIAAGREVGTLLAARGAGMAARKQWLAASLHVKGRLTIDAGAARVLREQGRSLLAVGVTTVMGNFDRGELVACFDPEGREVARGLTNYSSAEVAAIKGQPTAQFESILGFVHEPELIHRDNLVLV
jgi:glutamate 5-kinase